MLLEQRPVAQDLPRRPIGRDLPVVQQQDAVARLEHEVEIVRCCLLYTSDAADE